MRRTVTLALALWLAATVAALLLVDLDLGPTLVSLPHAVGVTAADLVAVGVLLAAWVVPALAVRARLAPRSVAHPAPLLAVLVVGLVAGALLALAVFEDVPGRKYAIGTGFLLVQVAAFAAVALPGTGARDGVPPSRG
jgi:hypothetical protein